MKEKPRLGDSSRVEFQRVSFKKSIRTKHLPEIWYGYKDVLRRNRDLTTGLRDTLIVKRGQKQWKRTRHCPCSVLLYHFGVNPRPTEKKVSSVEKCMANERILSSDIKMIIGHEDEWKHRMYAPSSFHNLCTSYTRRRYCKVNLLLRVKSWPDFFIT